MDELYAYFTEHYLPRREVVNRLPVSVSIGEIWPKILAGRAGKAVYLPLHAKNGEMNWYTPTRALLENGDLVAYALRRQTEQTQSEQDGDGTLEEEARCICLLDGIDFSPKAGGEAENGAPAPVNRAERAFQNTVAALRYAREHSYLPVTRDTLLELERILNRGAGFDAPRAEYRTGAALIAFPRQDAVFRSPKARLVPTLIDDLLRFLSDSDIHPLIKAAAAQAYFISVHPFTGTGRRTAAVLSDLILFRAGYRFFREILPAGLMAQNRERYERALMASVDPENGYDLTYFIQFYFECLAQAAGNLKKQDRVSGRLQTLKSALPPGSTRDRLTEGAARLLQESTATVTATEWQARTGVSFETARQDLGTLVRFGLLTLRTEGRKHFYDVDPD